MSTNPSCLKLGFAGTPDFAVPALERLAGVASNLRRVHPTRPPRRPRPGAAHESGEAPCARTGLAGAPTRELQVARGHRRYCEPRSWTCWSWSPTARFFRPPCLGVPRLGCLNIHASLLPRWRGAAPIQRALLAGDSVTGVTIMRMEAGLDTGPDACCRGPSRSMRATTPKSLHDTLAILGAQLIEETLTRLREGSEPRDRAARRWRHLRCKNHKAKRRSSWEPGMPRRFARQMRAFNPWPVAETRFEGEQLRIWEAEATDSPGLMPAAPSGRRDRCSRRRAMASTWSAARASCGFSSCNWPAAKPCRPGNSCGDSASTARASAIHDRGRRQCALPVRHAVARVLREGVTLDAALKDALVAADPKPSPGGAILELWRRARLLSARSHPGKAAVAAGAIAGFFGARAAVRGALRTRG